MNRTESKPPCRQRGINLRKNRIPEKVFLIQDTAKRDKTMKKNAKLILAAGCIVCLAGIIIAVVHFAGDSTPSSSPGSGNQGDVTAPPLTAQASESAAPQAASTVAPTTAPQAASTAAPTQTPKAEPTATPTQAPPAILVQDPAVYPSSNLASMLGDDGLAVLKTAGVIAAEPEKVTAQPDVTKADAQAQQVQIETVETFGDSYVVVTLNARLSAINTSDIAIRKYSDNWYSLSPYTTDMNIKDVAFTLNDEGKTVLIYQIYETIDGIRVIPDYSAQKLGDLAAETTKADNYMSWQMDNGGWDKGVKDQAARPWNGNEKKNRFSGWTAKGGGLMGTVDNDATYTQIRQIAAVYRETTDEKNKEKYKESVLKGLDFILNLQYESGGFAQVYPRRGNYSDHVTFNDEAMINVLIMLEDVRDKAYPFDSDIIPDEYHERVVDSINRAVDYILKAQITSEGRLTAWCAQHDPVTYEPRGARAYELPSISGSESVAIVKFLIHQKDQTPEIRNAIECALQWFRDSEVKGLRFDKNDPNKQYFIEDPNSSLWYRFYEIDTNRGIFCDRDGIAKYDIKEIGDERRNGYSWSGSWPRKLLNVYEEYGFYENRIEAAIVKTDSAASDGSTLQKGCAKAAEEQIK